MKVLHTTQEIRNSARDVLDDASSNRYAFVAFAGLTQGANNLLSSDLHDLCG